MPTDYVELHCHSCYSFREGASTPLELVLTARELGYDALALSDHDSLAGAMEYARAAKDWEITPIIGAEITVAGRMEDERPLLARTDKTSVLSSSPGEDEPSLAHDHQDRTKVLSVGAASSPPSPLAKAR